DPGDLLGGAIERGNTVRAVNHDQPGAHALEDEVLERLKVPEILLARRQLPTGRLIALGQTTGDDRHDEKRRGVEEHREEIEGGGFVRRIEEDAQWQDRPAYHDSGVEQAGDRGDGEAARSG